MKREKGYYWIYYSGGWEVAEFGDFGNWWVAGSDTPLRDEFITEIGRT